MTIPPERRPLLYAALAVAAAAFLLYSPSLGYAFVYDDHVDVRQVDAVFVPGAWTDLFTSASARLYRPLKYLSYRLDYLVGGWSPAVFHFSNLLAHAAVCALLVLLLHRRDRPIGPAALGGLWFALHPVHTEAVAWISGRANLLSAAFVLLSVLAARRWADTGSRRALAGCFAAALAGAFSKEDALILPAVFLLLAVAAAPARRRWLAATGVAAAAAALYLLPRQLILGQLAQVPREVPLSTHLLALPRFILHDLKQLVAPTQLAVDQPVDFSPAPLALLLVAALALLILIPRVPGWLRLALAWFFLFLAPVSGLVPLNQAVADRFLYLPAMGGALALCELFARADRHGRFVRPLAGALLVALAVRTTLHLPTWRNDQTLWEQALRVNPLSWRGWNNLAVLANQRGDFAAALPLTEQALALRPGYPEALTARGFARRGLGQLKEAEADYRQALAADADQPALLFLLADLLQQTGRLDEAARAYDDLFARRPHHVDARINAGVLAIQRGRKDEAIAHWQAALRADPGNADAARNLAIAQREAATPP